MYKLSIITINYNNKLGLKKTIQSVLNQTWNDFEYIIIDGGSNDGSKALIESHSQNINYWISEKDSGVYNAMNKGIIASKGEYLIFMNSGDSFADLNVLQQVFNYFDGKISIFYGNLYYNTNNIRTLLWSPPEVLSFSYFLNFSLPHPASFIKRELFIKYFLYNENYKIVSDWEFFIFCICKKQENYKYLDIDIVDFDNDGLSSRIENRKLITDEKDLVLKNHFNLFYEDSKLLLEIKSKRYQQIIKLKANKFTWIFLKSFISLLLIFKTKKESKQENYKKIL